MDSRKAIVVTGASSGIGAACAQALDALGHRVYGTCLDESERNALDGLVSDRVTLFPMDITDDESIARFTAHVAAELDGAGLDGLVNNAGIDVPGPLEFIPLEQVRRQFDVNVFGLLATTQALLPSLRLARGRIVNISSIDGLAVTPFQGAYGASKHAVEAISDILRMELAAWDIWVAAVQPGDIATPIWKKSLALADALLPTLPDEAHRLYGPMMGAARKTAEAMSKKAKPASTVANAVVHALTSNRPRARYMVGLDARLRLALEYLPTRMMDGIILRFLRSGGTK